MFELIPFERHARNVAAFDPFRELDELERSFFGNGRSVSSFRTDVTDEGDHFKITADLPGFEKENIHLDLYDDALTISAERHSEHEEKDKRDKYLCCERSYGAYSRTFNVTGIDTSAIKAKYDKGVLELILPKAAKEEKSAKRLEIE